MAEKTVAEILAEQGKDITIASASPAKAKLTKEQRRQRFLELSQRMGKSNLAVTPPAGKAGYWARKGDHKGDEAEMSRLEGLGFSIVHDDPKNPAWKAGGAREDGTYVVGDVILMEIDADLYQDYLDFNAERGHQLFAGAADAFRASAQEHDVPTFETKGRK
jgi:hypothetical protein